MPTEDQINQFAETSQKAAMAYVEAHKPSGVAGLMAGVDTLLEVVLHGLLTVVGRDKTYEAFQHMVARIENKLFTSPTNKN